MAVAMVAALGERRHRNADQRQREEQHGKVAAEHGHGRHER
jgi:hypothetical protein